MTENEAMVLEEAIVHSKEVAERNRVLANSDVLVQKSYDVKLNTLRCNKCADEHEQLAKWLEELQQYRAIGTVEEIENSFKKTINAFERANPLIKSALDILQEYQSIGTIEEFKALKEKRTAKSRRIVAGKYFCPECGRTADMGYCKACGQNLY